jgi:hypothetical protein
MNLRSVRLLATLGSMVLVASGCAVSEPLDLDTALAGTSGAGTGGGSTAGSSGGDPGSTGSGGMIGIGGVSGTGGGATGGAGSNTGTAGTSGIGGVGGKIGTTGIGGAGNGGRGGSASGGFSGGGGGRAGAGGAGGRGGAGGGPMGRGGSSNGGTQSNGAVAPTFTEIYKNILIVYCGGSNCHNPGSPHGVGFSTQAGAYKSLVSVAIIPGDSQGSTLYTNVATGAMPAGKPMLSDTLVAQIGAWIDNGALDN